MGELRGKFIEAVTHNFVYLLTALVIALGAWVFTQGINHAVLAQELKDHKALEAHPNTRQRQIDQIKGDVQALETEIKALRREQKSNHEAIKELIALRLAAIERLLTQR